MKILQLKIIDNQGNEIRNINFNENGTSIIYGQINQPNNDKKTSNSIGKTLLFKFISYILGRKENKNDYPVGIINWCLEAKVLYKKQVYSVFKVLGSNKDIKINGQNYSHNKYLEFFGIDRGVCSKQLFLEKRSNIISSVGKSPVKDDIKQFLTLLKLNELVDIFMATKNEQEKLKSYESYNAFFKEDIKSLQQKQFVLEQKRLKIEQELLVIKSKVEKLNISENSLELIELHSQKNLILKEKKILLESNQVKIIRLNELIDECNKADISYEDIISLYNEANIVIPEMTKRTVQEVQEFYNDMFKDKKLIYEEEIKEIKAKNKDLQEDIDKITNEINSLSEKIAENDIFKEAMNLYESKNSELIQNQEEYGRVAGVIDDLSNKKKIEDTIRERYILLKQKLDIYTQLIHEYRTYVYNLVNQIYEDDKEAYFDIQIPEDRIIQSMPMKVTLNLKGDKGEGISAVKNIVIDFLIFHYNDLVEYLMQDSSCFEGIDKRQTATLILKGTEIANETGKQYIISVNDYHLQKDNDSLMKLVNNNCILELSEEDVLLKKKI